MKHEKSEKQNVSYLKLTTEREKHTFNPFLFSFLSIFFGSCVSLGTQVPPSIIHHHNQKFLMHSTIGQNLFGKIQCILIRDVRDAFIAALAVLTRCCRLETLAAPCDGPWKTLSTTVQSHKKIVKITKSLYYFSHSFYLI